MGSGTAGHSHAGALAIVASRGAEELLIDPGAYTYIADPAARQRFRATAAHNTLTIDGQDQAAPAGPFRWTDPPETEILAWSTGADADILDAQCRYRGFTHRRSLVFLKPALLLVLDRVDGPPGEHLLEQRWLSPQGLPGAFLSTVPPAAAEPAERSRAFASLEPATRRIARLRATLPAAIGAAIGFGHNPALSMTQDPTGAFLLECEQSAALFPLVGPPEIQT
jgi:heparinase II/III-like protein